jgi:hypothetical protein
MNIPSLLHAATRANKQATMATEQNDSLILLVVESKQDLSAFFFLLPTPLMCSSGLETSLMPTSPRPFAGVGAASVEMPQWFSGALPCCFHC